MNIIEKVLSGAAFGSPCSEDTVRRVLSLCGELPQRTLVIGACSGAAELLTRLCAPSQAEFAAGGAPVQQSALVWYHGTAEFDGTAQRLELLRSACMDGGILVFRALCWLTEPSPDIKAFCRRRYGIVEPLDKILLTARECGFALKDFYIAPKKDWTVNYYRPILSAAEGYMGDHPEDGAAADGLRELRKETDIFEMHCEEYSYVYFVLAIKPK